MLFHISREEFLTWNTVSLDGRKPSGSSLVVITKVVVVFTSNLNGGVTLNQLFYQLSYI